VPGWIAAPVVRVSNQNAAVTNFGRTQAKTPRVDTPELELVLGMTMIALSALVLRWGFPKLPTS
jgi:hypothetical protein